MVEGIEKEARVLVAVPFTSTRLKETAVTLKALSGLSFDGRLDLSLLINSDDEEAKNFINGQRNSPDLPSIYLTGRLP